jgi:hypothetical protein
MKKYQLFSIFGITVSALPTALWGFIVLAVVQIILAGLLLDFSLVEAIAGGLLAALIFEICELIHHLGHAWAARRTGYPMTGVRFLFVLGMSLYPRDEPELPATVHIQRALGGPVLSMVTGILGAVVALMLGSTGGLLSALVIYFAAVNVLVFSLGALLPLKWIDGGTIRYWWGKR